MPAPRATARVRVLVGATLVAVAASLTGQSRQAPASADARLSTVLEDLAAVVPQVVDDESQPRPSLQAIGLPASVEDARDGARLRFDDDGRVHVYVLLEVTDARIRALEREGVVIEIVSVADRRVQARIPASRLRRVAALPFVDFIRPPSYAMRHTAGTVITEGDRIHDADLVRAQFGVDGAGVTVGVISDGIKGLFASGCKTCGPAAGSPLATGDLPPSTGLRQQRRLVRSSGGVEAEPFNSQGDLEGRDSPRAVCAFPGAGAEGGALLEIVHDLAPGAALRFANADTSLGFNLAVNALAAVSDIVVDDLGFYGEAGDGQSSVSRNTAAALNDPLNRIRAYVTSAGNAADKHYFGRFADSRINGRHGRFMPNDGALHRFEGSADTSDVLQTGPQPYNLIAVPEGGEVLIILNWDDPAGASGNNYDLFLVRHDTGQVVARSMDVQQGRQDPIEFIDYVNRGGAGLFRIVVQNVENRAAPRHLNLFAFGPQCAPRGPSRLVPGRHEYLNFTTPSRSLPAQSDAGGSPASVISVGAICSASALAAGVFLGSDAPSESCNDQTHRTIQYYSSQGPTLDGRMKPDISAIDGVSITGTGRFPNPFFGTSAAAPHVAGIAALALSAAPCLRAGVDVTIPPPNARVALRSLLLASADRLVDGLPNNIFGAGLANARAAVSAATMVCQ
jgi:subtilisin family serine protease